MDAIARFAEHVATTRFEDMTVEESQPMLDYLYANATKPEHIYRHRWEAGDLVIWDNRLVLHRGRTYDPTQRRVMHRATVAGDGPLVT